MRYFLLPMVFLLCAATLPAQFDKATFGADPIILKYADSLLGSSTEAGMVRVVKGNVRFVQGNVTVTCDEAVQYMTQNRVELIGNVVITQETVTLRTVRGEYNGNTKVATGQSGITLTDRDTRLEAQAGRYSTASRIADFYRDVTVENDSMLVYSDTLQYHRDTQNSFATGRVFARGKFSGIRLRGDSLSNIPAERYTRVSGGSPLFSRIDTVQAPRTGTADTLPPPRFDTLCISGDLLEARRDTGSEQYIATGNVRLNRGGLAARSTSGTYNHTEEYIRLTGSPVIWYDSTQLRGDSIVVRLNNSSLEQISAYRNAFAATKSDSTHTDRIDQLTGNNIFVMIAGDTLRRITAEEKAFSLYFLSNDGAPDGASRSSADMITVELDQGLASDVHWTGKVDGEYLPENMVFGRLAEYHLRNFAWFTDRPLLAAPNNPHSQPARKPQKKAVP